MWASQGLFLPDANAVRGRTNDYILPLRRLHPSVEGKLRLCLVLFVLMSLACHVNAVSEYEVVVFMCVWKRPLLTEFVLTHYQNTQQQLKHSGIKLNLFITGSENDTEALASKHGAAFAVFPNSPLGAKHDNGLKAVRDYFQTQVENGMRTTTPDAVVIVGSDDLINARFFKVLRDKMLGTYPNRHVVGLRDLHFYDLKSRRLVFTEGYRDVRMSVTGTMGCGRAFSWAILDALDWHLWEHHLERSLDQSAVRGILYRVPFVQEVSEVVGREDGVVGVDIKSDGYGTGVNIWKFDEVVKAVGKGGRLKEFVDVDEGVLEEAFGSGLLRGIEHLREAMNTHSSQ